MTQNSFGTPYRSALLTWTPGQGVEGSWVDVAVDADYRDDDAWGPQFDRQLDRLSGLGIVGVCPGRPLERGVYRFRCVPVVPLAGLLSAFPTGAGDVAAIQLFLAAAPIFDQIATANRAAEIVVSRSLGPLGIGVDVDGGCHLVGVGFPPLEVWDWLDDPSVVPSAVTLRHAPPERLAGEPEDVSTDLYVLALMCVELGTGKPVLAGAGSDLLEAVRRGDARSLLKGRMSRAFSGVLAPWSDQRPRLDEALATAATALEGASGTGLAAISAALIEPNWAKKQPVKPHAPTAATPPQPALPSSTTPFLGTALAALARAEADARRAEELARGSAEARAAAKAVERIRHAVAAAEAATSDQRGDEAARAAVRAADAARIAADALQRRATSAPFVRTATPMPVRRVQNPTPAPIGTAPLPPSRMTTLRRGTQRLGTTLADWENHRIRT